MLNKQNQERLEVSVEKASKTMKRIYGNKNSDEYKMHGDITKSQIYSTMEKLINDLPTLKGFPSSEAKDIKTMFMTLHRPIWKKMVTSYMAKPDERNTLYTMYFTLGYRTLRGELARIFASTEATEKGIVYKQDKIGRKEWITRYIRFYNDKLETLIEKAISEVNKDVSGIASAHALQEAAGTVQVVGATVNIFSKIATAIGNVFRTAKEVNPVAFISALLSRHYDKKVDAYDQVCAMYIASQEAYKEYMKLPAEQRKKKVENKYVKNIEKYNIMMNNMKAKIDHYDSRAMEYAKDVESGYSNADDGNYDEPSSKDDDNDDEDLSSSESSEKKEPKPSNDDDDGFDF